MWTYAAQHVHMAYIGIFKSDWYNSQIRAFLFIYLSDNFTSTTPDPAQLDGQMFTWRIYSTMALKRIVWLHVNVYWISHLFKTPHSFRNNNNKQCVNCGFRTIFIGKKKKDTQSDWQFVSKIQFIKN